MASDGGCSNSTASSTTSSTQTKAARVCDVHGLGELYTSNTDANPFRRFVRCPERRVNGCKFFRWVDEEMPAHYLGCVQRLKYQKDSLESQLQYKNLMLKTLYDKLEAKDAKSEALTPEDVPVVVRAHNVSGKSFLFVWVVAAILVAGLCKYW